MRQPLKHSCHKDLEKVSGSEFAGKCLLPLAMSLFDFLLLLVLLQSIYGIYVKSKLILIALALLPAIFSASLLGLAISAALTSQLQAVLSASVYFLALTLLSGFLYPISESSKLIQGLSKLFPLTFVLPMLKAWMFGASPILYLSEVIIWPSLQCVFFGILAVLVFRRFLYHI
jgi:ABC-type polysaccharide/polyol phosphate export permease